MTKVTFGDQTSFELENGEILVLADFPPPSTDGKLKLYLLRHVINRPGCLLSIITFGLAGFFKKDKRWGCNIAVTNKRVVSVPFAKEKNKPVESFYYKDMKDVTIIQEKQQQDEGIGLRLVMNDGEKLINIQTRITPSLFVKFALAAASDGIDKGLASAGSKLSYDVHQQAIKDGEMTLAEAQAKYDKDVAEYSKLAQGGAIANIQATGLPQFYQVRDYLANLIAACLAKTKQ